jgi:light-regulated signal transduction histidine kinase (bacteriophytochrome)
MLQPDWIEHVHATDRQLIQQKLPEWIAARTGWMGLVIRWMHRDGSIRFLESHARPLFDSQDNLIGFMGSDRDVTERERSQATLKQFSAELQRSNRELEEFALIASHDLQEPLRKLRSFGELLREEYGEALGGEGAEYLSEIVDASTRMQELVRSLLTLSRVGRKGLPFEEVDLNRALQAVLSDLEMRIKEAGGKIESGELPKVDADPVQMRQLFQNLIANSLKFRREDEPPVIRIEPNGFKAGDEEICIHVLDNGIGFEQEHAEKVFAPFQRLHGRAKYEGTGMGLAICRKIVERHGGSISAQSEPGHGTTFTIRMPVHHETAKTAD